MIAKNITIAATTLLMAALLQSCGSTEGKPESTAKAGPPSPETFALAKGQLSTALDVPGELIAYQQVDLYAKVSSFVKKLYVDVGSEVKEGQLLAVLEAPEMSAQQAAAASKLNSAEAVYIASNSNYNRVLETSKTPGTISPNDLDQALSKKNADYAQWQAAKASYKEVTDYTKYLEIRAPFSGIITTRNINPGAYVGPSGKDPLFTLQEQKKLRLVISVPEAYSNLLRSEDEAVFTVKSLPGTELKAKINRLAGALDNRLRAQRIEMDVTNNDKKLLPGMIANVHLPLQPSDSTFIVPKSAVVSSSEKTFVIRVADHKAQWVTVKKGNEADGRMEIYGALNAGDKIVKTGNEEIRDGSAVK